MSRLGVFKIMGQEYDLDDLTLDEMERVEELAGGVAFSEINYGSTKGLKAFTFVLLQRTNPGITMEEVGAVKVASFVEGEENMPPLPPDEEATSQNESEPASSGVQLSVASIPG